MKAAVILMTLTLAGAAVQFDPPPSPPLTSPTPHHKAAKAKVTPSLRPSPTPSPTPETTDSAVRGIAGALFLGVLYFIPCIVAYSRRHRNSGAIAALNIFLGWTLIGWVISLVWALTADVEPKAQAASGP